jgi:hypothetical protein
MRCKRSKEERPKSIRMGSGVMAILTSAKQVRLKCGQAD